MELFKKILISNLIGCLFVGGACVGIVGGSLVLCGVSALGLMYVGG